MVAYLPPAHTGTITVDMAAMSGPAQARWFDPTSGELKAVTGAPFANHGQREFATPGRNAAGDVDWVLLLETP